MTETEKTHPEIALTPVESSQIHALGHDPETETLAIQFKNFKGEIGSTYHYSNFTSEMFDEFKNAESIGKHFGERIKKEVEKHPYVKIA